MNKTKKCAQCGQEKPIEDFSKEFPSLCKHCALWNETQAKVNLAFDSYDSPRFIPDMRTQIATTAMQGLLAGGYKAAYKDLAITAVACADALLNELKKSKDENDEVATDK